MDTIIFDIKMGSALQRAMILPAHILGNVISEEYPDCADLEHTSNTELPDMTNTLNP